MKEGLPVKITERRFWNLAQAHVRRLSGRVDAAPPRRQRSRVRGERAAMAKFKSPLVAIKCPHPSTGDSVFLWSVLSSLRARFFHAERLAFRGDDYRVVE